MSYLFQIIVLYQMDLLKIFLPVLGSSSNSLILSFQEQNLMNSSLWIISFMDQVFHILSKKVSPYPKSSRFSPVLSPKCFIVLHFIFRSVIHFALFLWRYRILFRFLFFFALDVYLFPHHLLKTRCHFWRKTFSLSLDSHFIFAL